MHTYEEIEIAVLLKLC